MSRQTIFHKGEKRGLEIRYDETGKEIDRKTYD